MSNIKGTFFPYQTISAKALGSFAAKAVRDGVLAGCAISYVGTELTIGRGFLVACGRVMEVPGDVALTIDGAASGYARVSVLIDTTKTSIKDVFEQADFLVEYSTMEDGFKAVYDEDINMDGTFYQLLLCVVSLSAAGISGIVEELQQVYTPGAKILWETADETAAFPAQTVFLSDVNLLDYNAYYARFINDGRYYDFWVSRGDITSGTITAEANRTTTDGDYNYIYSHAREWKIDLDNNAFVFGAGAGGYVGYAYGTSWNDNAMKPVAIYGCNL